MVKRKTVRVDMSDYEDHYGDLVDGDLVKVKGLRGSFRFKNVRMEKDGPVLSLFGPVTGHRQMWRTVTPDRIK